MIEDIDGTLGYQEGQRVAHLRPNLDSESLISIGEARLREASRSLTLNRRAYLRGFLKGYRHELAGIAQPLPEERKGLSNGN